MSYDNNILHIPMYVHKYTVIYSYEKIDTPVSVSEDNIFICFVALFILCMSDMKYISFQNLDSFYAKPIARFS